MQVGLVLIFSAAKVLQFGMFVCQYTCRLFSANDIHNMFRTEFLVQLMNSLQYQTEQLRRIHHLICLTAVITTSAVVFLVVFAKIVQQQFPTTNRTLRIRLCLKQQLIANLLLRHRLALLEFPQALNVFGRIEADTLSLATITTSTTSLLVIAFQ